MLAAGLPADNATPVGLPTELKSLFPAQIQQIIDQADNTALSRLERPLKLALRMERGYSCDDPDFLGENRPSGDQLFQTGTGVELDQTLTEGEPVIERPSERCRREHPLPG